MQVIVVKYGGNAMADLAADPVLADCASLSRAGRRIVLVHGGGPQIDAELRARGIAEERVDGLRVTSAPALEVVECVLCATVNKELVRALGVLQADPVGISGEDGGLLWGRRFDERLGAVGEIVEVRPRIVRALIEAGFLPVVAPLALDRDQPTGRLNVNADTAAGALAAALRADAYIVVTDVPRILRDRNDPTSGIEAISAAEARSLMAAGVFADGMIPKAQAAIAAVEHGVARAVVCAAGANAIGRALAGEGTTIFP